MLAVIGAILALELIAARRIEQEKRPLTGADTIPEFG
jgi:hypothetical protein